MPELPEVETIARTLAPQINGRRTQAFRSLRAGVLQSGQALIPWMEGARILQTRRRAKILLLDLLDRTGSPLLLAVHLKMTGRLSVHPPETAPHKHTRITLDLYPAALTAADPESRLFFDDVRAFGYCRIMRPEDLPQWIFWAKLGLEPLEHDPDTLAALLARKNSQIKNLLLDQRLIAGIGNIYADEALFRAGLRPDRKSGQIPGKHLTQLCCEIQKTLREAIAACGSSIRDYRDAQGNAGSFQNSFNVYGRGGEPCKRCGTKLKSCRITGRGTTYCPRCQK